VPLPPFGEQLAILAEVNKITECMAALSEEADIAIGRLQERRSALIAAAVTGKIDVGDELQCQDSSRTGDIVQAAEEWETVRA